MLTKEQLDKEHKIHSFKAAQAALALVEAKKQVEDAQRTLDRETGAVLILQGLLDNKNEPAPTDKI